MKEKSRAEVFLNQSEAECHVWRKSGVGRIWRTGAVWGCSAEGQISHVLSARESSRPMRWSKTGVHKMTQLRIETRNGTSLIDLMEYQQKNKKIQIEQQDELVREVKRKHSLSHEEVVRKEIPGLERKGMYWMRDLIYKRGTTA